MPRRLGQHFLNNPKILSRIAEAACPEPCRVVIEIGPGKGTLTRRLLDRAERVVAIELDPYLARGLAGLSNRLEVVEADVLKTDLSQWGPATVAGNLPYYITSPIVEKVLAMGPLLRNFVCMTQFEVAERITASSGVKEYGYLSVSVQSRCHAERLFTVPPGAFSPPPKVTSAVIRIAPKPPVVDPIDPFLEFVSRCFSQKRKTLRNNLRSFYNNRIEAEPEAGMRAEQLSIPQLASLYGRLTVAR
jgi:16S rRNA (adenine1518-N6/adenine1519-N6)-dimethyltransferase